MSNNIFAAMRERVLAALAGVLPELDPAALARVEVTPTREAAHGDMATNAALVVAKAAKRKPAEIAAALVTALAAEPMVASAEAAGPGFVNLRLHASGWAAQVPLVLRAGEEYGRGTAGQGVRVNVEYVSANPTGPMHVGHCRGAVVGDVLANLLAKAGFEVRKEYYINDAGNQVAALAWAAYWRYLQAVGSTLSEEDFSAQVPGGLQYRGEYLVEIGAALAAAHGAALAGPGSTVADTGIWFVTVRDFTLERMMDAIREDLALLGVHQEVFSSERALAEAGAADITIAQLQQAGLIYEGVLDPPKGKTPDDWEPRKQTLFRATAFGDDVDRPLRKSDGTATYFANDIAYHADKMRRGADVLIDVLGADHGGYVSRMTAAVKALSAAANRPCTLEVVLCQMVKVLKDGEPVRMSKRAGTFITLRDLLEEVGRDAVRFTMLTRKSDAQMEFDIAAAVAQTRENPVFYVQYAHARCRSILRAAGEMLGEAATTPQALAEAELASLAHDADLALIRRIASWPRVVEAAALAREPHRIAFFLYDLAADFHMLWNRGRDDAALRFLRADAPEETRARVALVAATAMVIRSGLAVMGVAPVEEMR
jgi:arginyl-tRNA synthetase